ncbi:MAG: 5-formyltetrahydrofolate cyclo-ligase [Alphaproteobacteria bacterium]|nr:5-formyltetrahydrofolate cyclo-ligase [Alphaproteobacteria bacterium]
MTDAAAKSPMRAAAAARRRVASEAGGAAAALAARDAFLAAVPKAPGAVAGYWPIGDELDIRPLLTALAEAKCEVALPAVAGRGMPLEFRPWTPGQPLEAGAHGTRHPPADAGRVRPALLLVPLLAFDREGWRLGYGGGYYDRSLSMLRQSGRVIAVGVGFAAQEVGRVPHDDHDQRLDAVLTERGFAWIFERRETA